MGKQKNDWERYERLVARIVADQLSTAYCVTPNARVQGKISGRKRQIDVLIDSRHDTDNLTRLIVDAKKRSRLVDVTHVEAFLGLMADVNATHGYLVCPCGYTKAAERRAQNAVSIRLLPLDRMDNFDPSTWPRCLTPNCRKGRVFWDGYPSIDMAYTPVNHKTDVITIVSYVHYVGKCDQCSRFHVKCLTCDDFFSPTYESDDNCGVQCKCHPPWFWIASVESDSNGQKSAELHVIKTIGQFQPWTVDRRSF